MLTSRDISRLRPDVAANCRLWIDLCAAAGLNVLVTGTVRDDEYQQYLYAQGRTRPGAIVTNSPVPTFHSEKFGLAFDFCQNNKGREYSDLGFFSRAAAVAKRMGFEWGGDWTTFTDRPHLQWAGPGAAYKSADLLAGRVPPYMPLYLGGRDAYRAAIQGSAGSRTRPGSGPSSTRIGGPTTCTGNGRRATAIDN